MIETPAPSKSAGGLSSTFGFGWHVTRAGSGYELLRDGALPDTAYALLLSRPDGLTAALTFNSIPDVSGGSDSPAARFGNEVITMLERIIATSTKQ